MSNSDRATLLAVSYLGVCRQKLLELADDYDANATTISNWLEDGYPDDPESIRSVSNALNGAGAAVIALEALTALMANAVRAAVLEDTPPLAEVAQA